MSGTNLVPDLLSSSGVTGYKLEKDRCYVHTDGSTLVVLQLTNDKAQPLHLTSSTQPIRFLSRDANHAKISLEGWEPGTVTFGGAGERNSWVCRSGSTNFTAQSGQNGELVLVLPPGETYEIRRGEP
jgi:hypothetical protein